MNSESTTPRQSICEHKFERLQGEKGPNGEWVMVCQKCAQTKLSEEPKPLKESSGEKPLLME